MKLTQFFFALVAFTLFFSSCDDEENDINMADALVGTWTLESLDSDITTDATFTSNGQTTTVMTDVDATATDSDYEVTFMERTFTTSGSYTLDTDVAITTNGNTNNTSSTEMYTGVSSNGNYTTSGNQITVNGTLFYLELNGQPLTTSATTQTATYSISGDLLTITQNETMDMTFQGVPNTVTIVSTSTFRRQ